LSTSRPTDRLATATKFDDVTYAIRRLIAERRLGPNDRLPSERALADLLAVSRTSVREAFRRLEAMGLIQTTARQGAFVAAGNTDAMSSTIRGWFEARQLKLAHLIEFRRALESAAAAAAAKSHIPADLANMESDLLEMHAAAARNDPVRFAQADEAFHNHVAAASHNPLFSAMLETVADLLRVFREAASRLGPQILARSLADHRGIYEAIAISDEGAASAAMVRHIVDTAVDFHIVAREEVS
jgi:GntR family transcriptional regulator, transcriptional repressor for pyruvate dehydrogenase complex